MTYNELKSEENKYVMNTYGRFPIALDHGEGATLWDVEGKKYIDLASGIGVNCLGYANPAIWSRLLTAAGTVTAGSLTSLGRDRLQQIGMTYKKADYMLDFAKQVKSGTLNLEQLWSLSDKEVILELTKLKGVGVWTAEMILTFCMQRPNVVSFGDLAIQRGMRMLYRHRQIDRTKFERYQKRYAPYGTVAGLYLWAIAGGAIPELTDPAGKR